VKGFKINIIGAGLSIWGLVLLLLFSPCKVRNFIQAELEIPQTQVLNKSQSTTSLSNCQTYKISGESQAILKSSLQSSDLLISGTENGVFALCLCRHSFVFPASRKYLFSDVPLYILYQNLKIYS